MEVIPKEYYITNKYSKFSYKFNRPKIVKLTPGEVTPEMLEKIKSTKYGVIIQYGNEDEEVDEGESDFKFKDSCPKSDDYGRTADFEEITKLFGDLYDEA